MGSNATVVVLLDQLDQIGKDPEFGKKLVQAILWRANNGPGKPLYDHYPEPYLPGQTQVVEVHHADNQVIVAVGANYGRVIGMHHGWTATGDQIIKDLYKDIMRREREEKKKAKKKDLVCPTCKKDFTGYDLAVTRVCERCSKLVPFLKEKENAK
jgi:hypothetical protein